MGAASLLIGLGGTGSRVVNEVAKELKRNGKEFNNGGDVYCAVLDTDGNDNKGILKSGTDIPVIPTGKSIQISEIIRNYPEMIDWCPDVNDLLDSTISDGASAYRIKSRIAFMDCMKSRDLQALEQLTNDLIKYHDGSVKMRILIVSSVAGGTGSGMFIQVALWLREHFKNNNVEIRGMFLLPDIFRKDPNVNDNPATVNRIYANTYAAIRELHAIDKIKKGALKPSTRITIDGLFDSETFKTLKPVDGKPVSKPVYDFAFFVDDFDQRNVSLDSLKDYEKMVAQMVYMQLYSPLTSQLYPIEDNVHAPVPYGACGVSKAVYPTENVKEYCAIRATQKVIDSGWKKIDNEIDALIKEKSLRERHGDFSGDKIDVKEEFIKIYEFETSIDPDKAGNDRFFVFIKDDDKDIKYADKVKISTSKANNFANELGIKKINEFVNKLNGKTVIGYKYDEPEIQENAKKKGIKTNNHSSKLKSITDLKNKADADQRNLESMLNNFDTKVDEYAQRIVDQAFPLSMGKINAKNKDTVYGLLTKPDDKSDDKFINPVTARYILYKLEKIIKNSYESIEGAKIDYRKKATATESESRLDNPLTSTIETKIDDLIKNRGFWEGKKRHIDNALALYDGFIKDKIKHAVSYEKAYLKQKVLKKFLERLEVLIAKFEWFFEDLDNVNRQLDHDLHNNINASKDNCKTVYVYAKPENKETIYSALHLDEDENNSVVNKTIIDTIYGKMCAEKRDYPENAKYKDISIGDVFLDSVEKAFIDKINNIPENLKKVDMNIYMAATIENKLGFDALKNNLEKLASFTLNFKAPPIDRNTYQYIFWGLNEDFGGFDDAVPESNIETQKADIFPINELYCFRSIYGLTFEDIPKFNETNGIYYENYSLLIKKMLQSNKAPDQEYQDKVVTPHLDKNWHEGLPYLTREKQNRDNFYHAFWLAVGTGLLKIDKGYICIVRTIKNDKGEGFKISAKPIEYNDQNLVATNANDISALIDFLSDDKDFINSDIPRLEDGFKETLRTLTTYVNTEVYKGLSQKDNLNAIDVVIRYLESARCDIDIFVNLKNALWTIASELVRNNNVKHVDKKAIENATWELCKKLYDSGKRTKGKSEAFSDWEEKFNKKKNGGAKSSSKKSPVKKTVEKAPSSTKKTPAKKSKK